MLYAPDSLKKGDKIAIISTARKISKQELEPAIEWFEKIGLEVVLGKTIGAEDHQFAGSDDFRAADFQSVLDDTSIKAIVMGRGGYGTARVLDKINFNHFVKHSKWIIGYSDYTLLFNYINQFLGIQTLHATMPINFKSNTDAAFNSLENALFGRQNRYDFEGHCINFTSTISGEVYGGNLSILYSLLGTHNGFQLNDKILMLEDLDEYVYHVDRMMIALKNASKLKHLKALIVGGMTKMRDNDIPFGKTAEEIIIEHCSEYGYPIIFNAPFGHIDDNRALKLGSEITVEKNQDKISISMM